jgi:hypothetical protein
MLLLYLKLKPEADIAQQIGDILFLYVLCFQYLWIIPIWVIIILIGAMKKKREVIQGGILSLLFSLLFIGVIAFFGY